MSATTNSNERLMKILQATPEQLAAVDRILAGQPLSGPFLIGMSDAARLLGLSRATLWRMIRAGRLEKVEILRGSHRLRRADVEMIAFRRAQP